MKDETPSQAQHVVGKLGGLIVAARLLGHRNPSTVQGWLKRGFIPQKRHQLILDVAAANSIALTPNDFLVHLRKAPEVNNDLSSESPSQSEVAA